MDLHISFKNMDRSQALQVYTKDKSEKLKKYFNGRISVSWNFSIENVNKIAHCRLTGNSMDYFGEGESDDIRSSLSYKLKRLLKIKAERVLCTDPYVSVDDDLVPLDQVLEQADILVVGAPHRAYAQINPTVPAMDVWNILGTGARA